MKFFDCESSQWPEPVVFSSILPILQKNNEARFRISSESDSGKRKQMKIVRWSRVRSPNYETRIKVVVQYEVSLRTVLDFVRRSLPGIILPLLLVPKLFFFIDDVQTQCARVFVPTELFQL